MIIMEKSKVKVSMSIQVRISSRLGRSSNIARIEIAAVAISMEITCGCMELLEFWTSYFACWSKWIRHRKYEN